MKRRRVIVVMLACVVAAVVVAMIWPREREPEYKGKWLSEWITQYARHQNPKSADAVRHIGTNALPWLVRWMRYERPKWREKLSTAYGRLPRPLVDNTIKDRLLGGKRERTGDAATLAFLILGPEAAPAVPELIIMLLNDSKAPTSARRAIVCLAYLGKDAEPCVPYLARFTTPPLSHYAAGAVRVIESSRIEFETRELANATRQHALEVLGKAGRQSGVESPKPEEK